VSGKLEGDIHHDWMGCLNIIDLKGEGGEIKVIDVNKHPKEAVTLGPAGRDIDISMDKKDSNIKPENYFLSKVLGIHGEKNKNGWLNKVDKSKFIPQSLRHHVKTAVGRCIGDWYDEGKKGIYKHNGNGPLMTYSAQEGLVCLNSPWVPQRKESGVPKIVKNIGCPSGPPSVSKGKGGPCLSSSPCGWEDSDGWLDSGETFFRNNFSLWGDGGPCTLSSCEYDFPGLCGRSYIQTSTGDMYDGVKGFFSDLYSNIQP